MEGKGQGRGGKGVRGRRGHIPICSDTTWTEQFTLVELSD